MGALVADLSRREGLTWGKNEADGACTATLGLRALDLCTVAEIISRPSGKLDQAQEFLEHSAFGPGVTRIPLGEILELTCNAEHSCL